MKHMITAIDAHIKSLEDKVIIRQSAIVTQGEQLLTLHKLKEYYKEEKQNAENSKRSKPKNTTAK